MDWTAAAHSFDTDSAAANSRSDRKDNTLLSASRYRTGREREEEEEAAAEEAAAVGGRERWADIFVDGKKRKRKPEGENGGSCTDMTHREEVSLKAP